jgi:ATP phosphoribosyltransferase
MAMGGHGSGTVGEDDVREAWLCSHQHQLDRRVRLDTGHARLVGKGRRPAAGVGGI